MDNLIEKARAIAEKAHCGQVDKGGHPYIDHPLYVASCMADDESKVVALLHDTVEDSDLSFEALEAAGFPDTIVMAVDAITKRPGEGYDDYIERVSANRIATQVKIADMQHNSDLSRIKEPGPTDRERVKKYSRIIEQLRSV